MNPEKIDNSMGHWGPGVTLWKYLDKYYAVCVDTITNGLPVNLSKALDELGQLIGDPNLKDHKIMPKPTTIVLCDENGMAIDGDTSTPAIDLVTVLECSPGTSDIEAMEELVKCL